MNPKKMKRIMNKTMRDYLPLFNLTWHLMLKTKTMRKYMGWYEEGDDNDHNITLSYTFCISKRAVRETLIHELVHAWQNENKYPVNHGKIFRQWKHYLKEKHNVFIGKRQKY